MIWNIYVRQCAGLKEHRFTSKVKGIGTSEAISLLKNPGIMVDPLKWLRMV